MDYFNASLQKVVKSKLILQKVKIDIGYERFLGPEAYFRPVN
jgi:hypothetical protein